MSEIKTKSNFFRASAEDFKKIPGSPVAYWVSEKIRTAFKIAKPLSEFGSIGKGLDTGDNERFLRQWFEVHSHSNKWVPCQKGGTYRKWYGNNEFVINWFNNGEEIKQFDKSNIRNSHNYFRSGLSWTRVSSGSTAFRFFPKDFIFESTGPCIFPENLSLYFLAGFLNSRLTLALLKIIAPTLDFQSGHISMLPMIFSIEDLQINESVKSCIEIAKNDWDTYETSWDFSHLHLYKPGYKTELLEKGYKELRLHWQKITIEMQQLEEENNRTFIEAYGLVDELTSDVPLKEITLTCNPYYRYGVDADKSVEPDTFPLNKALEDRLKSDTMKELVSYAVGCMFGRYSLDKKGLILANSGDGIDEYMHLVPEPRFMPDESGILPLTEADDFTDDLPTQFYRFLRAAFGEENYHENLRFIEDSIGKSVRQYFLRDFFKDHVQRYKKRPVYWQVTSPNGSFRAFIYLHRYTKDTVGQVLNDYVRPFEKKLESRAAECRHISTSSSTGTKEKIQAQKDVDRFEKALQEITEWDANVLRPLALKRIELDLDDGVKVNYAKLGDILEPVVGLNR